MPNIAQVFKVEIARLARKETRGQMESLKKAVVTQRSDLAALKRRIADLERAIGKLSRGGGTAPKAAAVEGEAGPALRFSAARFASQRQKMGLSAAQMGQLIGVSSQSIYKWETGSARPRRSQLAAIAKTRGMGKKAVQSALEGASAIE